MSSQSPQDPQPKSLWKSMFSKLVGPDSSDPVKPLNDPHDLDGLDLDLLPPEKPQPSAKPAARVRDELSAVTFDSEPEEETPPAPVRASTSRRESSRPASSRSGASKPAPQEPPEVLFSDEEDAVDEDLALPPEVQAQEPPGDDYWDAIADLSPGVDADEPAAAPRGGGRGPRGGGGGRGGSGRRDSQRRDSRGERPSPRGERPARDPDAEPKRSSERPARSSERPARPAPVNSELFEDDDFGVGLTEESRAQVAALEAAAEIDFDSPEDGTESGDRPKRRRGRRGRRGRGRTETTAAQTDDAGEVVAEAAAADEVDFDSDVPETPVPRGRRERRPAPRPEVSVDFDTPDVEDDGFGAGLISGAAPRRVSEEEEEDEEEAPRRRSRRGRRGRGGAGRASVAASAPAVPVDAHADVDDDVDDHDDADDHDDGDDSVESAADRRDRYRNIPTWEEAIGYLVRPKRRTRDTGRSSGGGRSRGSR